MSDEQQAIDRSDIDVSLDWDHDSYRVGDSERVVCRGLIEYQDIRIERYYILDVERTAKLRIDHIISVDEQIVADLIESVGIVDERENLKEWIRDNHTDKPVKEIQDIIRNQSVS